MTTTGSVKKIVAMGIMIIAISGMLVSICASTYAADKIFKLKMQAFTHRNSVTTETSTLPFVKYAKEMSNGRLDIQYFDGGVLVNAKEGFSAVSDGVIDILADGNFYQSGIMPVQKLIYGYPGCYRNLVESLSFLHRFGGAEILREAYKKHNAYFLGIQPDAGVSLLSKKPIRTVEDLKGLKVRVGGGLGATLKAAGASPVSVSPAEIYTSLSTGVIDGVVYGGVAVADRLKLQEIAKYWMTPYLLGTHNIVVYLVNLKTWNELPDDLKAILQAAFNSVETKLYEADYNLDRKVAEVWREKYGVKFINFPEEEHDKLNRFSVGLMDELAAKDPVSAKAVSAIKEMWKALR